MDHRRLDTGQVLALGIPYREPEQNDIPETLKVQDCDVDKMKAPELLKALKARKMLSLPEYYGCVYAWSDKKGHHGRLMQYKNLTEKPDFKTPQELVEWFIEIGHRVAG